MEQLTPTRSPAAPQLAGLYDTRGQVVAGFLSSIYQRMLGNPGPVGNGALWWLRWLQRTKGSSQYKEVRKALQGEDQGFMYFDADPSVQYAILLALETNVSGLIRGLADYPDLHVPVEMTLFQTGTNLTDQQWVSAGRDYVDWAAENVAKGLLSVNYLDAIIQGLDTETAEDRKWAIFSPPAGLSKEESDSFRFFLDKIGYNRITNRWLSQSMAGWRRETAALNSRIAWLGVAERAASYASGYAAVQKVESMLGDFFSSSQDAHRAIASVEQLYADGKLEGVDPALLQEFSDARHGLGQNEQEAYQTLNRYDLWEGGRPRVYPAGLGIPVTQVVLISAALIVMAILSFWLHREVNYKNRILKTEEKLSAYALDVLRRKEYLVEKEHQEQMRTIEQRVAAGELTDAEASRLLLEANRTHQSKLTDLQDEIASVPTPNHGGAGLGTGAALLGVAAIGGLALWKLKG